LRQFGVAFNSYHDAHKLLPPAVVWFPYGEPLGSGVLPIGVVDRVGLFGSLDDDRVFANWVAMLLPHIEEYELFQELDRGAPISSAENFTFRAAELVCMKCPSDPYNSSHFFRGLGAGLKDNEYARGNYAINVGPDKGCVVGTTTPEGPCESGFIAAGGDLITQSNQAWGSGVAGVNRSFRFADVTDGLSQTILLDEIRCGIDRLDPRGVWALGLVASSMTAQQGKFADANGPNPSSPGSDEFIGCTALTQKLGASALGIERMPCYVVGTSVEISIQGAARSTHPAGLNVLFADGSVHFTIDDIDRTIWHSMHTRGSADTITLD
jgi:prepilin-type processing-associated H-X9-DG protein